MTALELQADKELPPALIQVRVQQEGNPQASPSTQDWVANEVPIALSYNGISHAVMLATPQDLEDFALGFALSEGIVDTPADCYEIDVRRVDASPGGAIHIDMQIASAQAMRLKQRRRAMAGNTGCGICGVESLQMLDLQPGRVPASRWVTELGAAQILQALHQLEAAQPLNALAGSLHAAGWARPGGQLLAVREDVGRHNALDKLLGHAARQGWLGKQGCSPEGFVILSSRASYELVRKCARLGIPAMAVVSAPTALALDVARQAGIRLWGWARGGRVVAYR